MKAIIPAGGLGSRLFPFTYHINKLLVPLLNKPILFYLLEELEEAGISEVIITGRNLSLVKKYCKEDKALNTLLKKMSKKGQEIPPCKISFIEQTTPKGWLYEVWKARKKLTEPFLIVHSDTVFTKNGAKQVLDIHKKTGKNVAASVRYLLTPEIFPHLSEKKFFLGDDTTVIHELFDTLKKEDRLVKKELTGKLHVGTVADYKKALKTLL